MNNQQLLEKKIMYAIKEDNEDLLDKVYPKYSRYISYIGYIGKGNVHKEQFMKTNTIYADYKINKHARKKNSFFEWDEGDTKEALK